MEKANFIAYSTLVTDSQTLLSTCIIYLHQHCPKGSVLGLDWCFSWDSGSESLGGSCAGTDSPRQNGPQIPKENPLEARGVQRQLVPPWALVSRRQPCNPSQGGYATKAEGDALWVRSPRHLCSHRHRQPGRREAGVCPTTWTLLHPLLPGVAQGGPGIRQNGEQDRATERPSPSPNHCPTRVEGGTAGPPHLHYTQNIPKEEFSQQFLLTRQDKPSPGRSGSHLVGFKGEEHTPRRGRTWAPRAHEQHDPPHQAYKQTASLHKHWRLANPLRQCTARKRFPSVSLIEKAAKRRLVHSNLHRLSQRERTALGHPRRQPGGKSYTCVSIQKLQNQMVTLYYIYCP